MICQERISEAELLGMRAYNSLDKQTAYKHRLLDALRAAYAEIDAQGKRIVELEAELEWYHTLKIVRSDDNVTRIDGGETAQLLHEMWEENLHLKAELEKRPGLSQEETEDILGGKMMNTVQQGAELLSRGKKIDTLKGRITELEKGLRELGCDLIRAVAANTNLRQAELLQHARARIDAMLAAREDENRV